jgi:GTP-binding protein Era
MVETALASVQGADVILFLVEATARTGDQETMILEALARVKTPVLLVINKIDLVAKESLFATIAAYARLYPFSEIVPICANSGDGVEQLVQLVHSSLPEGPAYFPDDILTDLPERFIVSEIIREQVFRLTHDDIPYSVAVAVESFKERDSGVIVIAAAITVEKDSQKGIIIGRSGGMLKKIGSLARLEIERLLGARVFLELFVRVRKEWSENPQMLKEFGYK